jgi:hypothetical protein
MLKKGVQFQWTPVTAQAFRALQQALIDAPILVVPDIAQPFEIKTDACQTGVGAVLIDKDHPIAYLSKSLCSKNQALSTYEKE